ERPQSRHRHAELPVRPDHGDDPLDPDDPDRRGADLARPARAAALRRHAVGMSLKARLEAEIAATGPIDVAAFMARCLFDPEDGYYATRPALGAAAELWLIEASAPLKARQAERLAHARPSWATSLAELPADAPLLLVANELLDCLP